MPSFDPGDLVQTVPRILRIEAGRGSATLSSSYARDFRRVVSGHSQSAARVVLVNIDLGKLLVCNLVRQTRGEAQCCHIEPCAGRHSSVLEASVGDPELTKQVWSKVRCQCDIRVAGRVRAYRCSGKCLINQ